MQQFSLESIESWQVYQLCCWFYTLYNINHKQTIAFKIFISLYEKRWLMLCMLSHIESSYNYQLIYHTLLFLKIELYSHYI